MPKWRYQQARNGGPNSFTNKYTKLEAVTIFVNRCTRQSTRSTEPHQDLRQRAHHQKTYSPRSALSSLSTFPNRIGPLQRVSSGQLLQTLRLSSTESGPKDIFQFRRTKEKSLAPIGTQYRALSSTSRQGLNNCLARVEESYRGRGLTANDRG